MNMEKIKPGRILDIEKQTTKKKKENGEKIQNDKQVKRNKIRIRNERTG